MKTKLNMKSYVRNSVISLLNSLNFVPKEKKSIILSYKTMPNLPKKKLELFIEKIDSYKPITKTRYYRFIQVE